MPTAAAAEVMEQVLKERNHTGMSLWIPLLAVRPACAPFRGSWCTGVPKLWELDRLTRSSHRARRSTDHR